MIARQFPPHRTAESGVLDVLDFLASDLRVVVRDHGAGCGVVGPGCYCLRVVEDLGVGLGEGLWGGKLVLVCVWEGFVGEAWRYGGERRFRLDQVKSAHCVRSAFCKANSEKEPHEGLRTSQPQLGELLLSSGIGDWV
jgi:hypothetical protein